MYSKCLPTTILTSLLVLAAAITALPAAAAPQFESLHAFDGTAQGGGIFGSLLLDASGNLYGTARDGGTPNYGYGTAFRLTPGGQGYTETLIHHFDVKVTYRHPDGINPRSGLIADPNGNLYGTTFYGGEPSDRGVVYELTPDTQGGFKEKILHSFNHEDGRYPWGQLTFDKAGNLYGTTYGVPYYCGTVFRLTPSQDGTWTETVLHDFGRSSNHKVKDGCEPTSGVAFDAAGNLYGTTSGGGKNGYDGIVYELSPKQQGQWDETILHKFTLNEGDLPYAGVTVGPSGELYGTTFGGGDQSCYPIGCGTVFKLTPVQDGSWSEAPIYRFSGPDGENPLGGVIVDATGNLYGTTDYGGNQSCAMGCGVVFKLSPRQTGMWQQTVLHMFDGIDGFGPGSNLIFDPSGHLFGTTISGGITGNCCGTAFEITP